MADEQLFARVTSARNSLKRVTFPQVTAILFSAIVYLFYVLAIIGSLRVMRYGTPLATGMGITLLLSVLWVIFPRFDVTPLRFVLTGEDEFPMLNKLVERVANALHTRVPKVMLTEQFTASFARVGWRRQPILGLGHPFLSLLNAEELVSLLAHELSHSQDGAVTRSIFVRQALQSTRRWQRLVMPARWFSGVLPNSPLHKFLVATTWLLMPVALPAMLLEKVIHICSLQDSQRAEYVADASSVTVAGTRDTLSLLKKSYYQHLGALRSGYSRAESWRKYEQLHVELASVPAREIDRVWRIAQRQPAQLTGTHPSLPKRIAFLQSLDPKAPEVTITAVEFAQLRGELTAWPCVIRKREKDWHAQEKADAATAENGCVSMPLPSAAD